MSKKKRKRNFNVFKVTQYQPNDTVTCSSVLVEVDGLKILLDLGLLQDSSMTFKQLYHANMQKLQSIPFDELDYVVVSHAHYDHISALPILAREETKFNGAIIMTELTAELGNLNMLDAQKINQSEVAKYRVIDKTKYRTFYDKKDVEEVMNMIHCYDYEREIILSDKVTIELLPACHLSGACMIYITFKDEYNTQRLLFTGDFSYGHIIQKPFTKRVLDKCLKANVVICESTYGDRDKKLDYSPKSNPIDFLENVIEEQVVNENQTLWLPSFAIHRATTLYLYLDIIFKRNERIKSANIPVFFCGQLMEQAHNIIGDKKFECYYDEEWNSNKTKDMFYTSPFKFLTTKEDVETECYNNKRKIVVSSSGMFDKGYSALLSSSYVPNKRVSVICCGYMGEGTLGYSIKNGEATANVGGIKTKVKCKYCGVVPNLSGHANHNDLINFIKSLNQSVLKTIILVHGDTKSKLDLKYDLKNELSTDKNIVVPKQFQTIYC